MGALPKNKITSAERGKRRRGNTRQIKKDPKTTQVQMHKRGFVAQLMKQLGIGRTAASAK